MRASMSQSGLQRSLDAVVGNVAAFRSRLEPVSKARDPIGDPTAIPKAHRCLSESIP